MQKWVPSMSAKIILAYLKQENEPQLKALAQKLAAFASSDVEVEMRADCDLGSAKADLVVLIFHLREGAFTPLSEGFQNLEGQKVAILGLLSGSVDLGRVRKTLWRTKNRLAKSDVSAAYFCAFLSAEPFGVSGDELSKCLNFIEKSGSEIVRQKLAPPVLKVKQ